jgi:hypothetical protein
MTLPRDAFYVGYLKLPPALRRPVFAIIALLVAADALLAVLVVWAEPAHPSGAWDQGGEIWFEGRFRARPYPLIEAVTAEGPRIVLLVQEGKHGAPEGLQGLDGQFVSASGCNPPRRPDRSATRPDAGAKGRTGAAGAAAGGTGPGDPRG